MFQRTGAAIARTTVAVVLVACCSALCGSVRANDLESQFRTGCTTAHAEWKRIESQLAISDVSEIKLYNGGKLTDHMRLTRKELDGQYVRAVEYLLDKATAGVDRMSSAYVRNHGYSIQLSRTKAGWVLRQADLNAPSRQASIESIAIPGFRKTFFPEYALSEKHAHSSQVFG
jgi:hypothetical protein